MHLHMNLILLASQLAARTYCAYQISSVLSSSYVLCFKGGGNRERENNSKTRETTDQFVGLRGCAAR